MSRAARRRKQREQAKTGRQDRKGLLRERGTRLTALVLAVALLASLGTWGVVSLYPDDAGPGTVLRVVNGQAITERDLIRRENVLRYLYGLGRGAFDAALREALLEQLVDEHLVEAEAERRGLTVTDEDLAQTREGFEQSLEMAYKTRLARSLAKMRLRVTDEDLDRFARGQVYAQKLYQEVTAEVSVTEEDILALYEEYKESLDEAGLSLEDVRDTLTQDALREKREEVYSRLLMDLRAKAEVSGPG
jgi:parvulin-like peptidyl-prolyl isomerase